MAHVSGAPVAKGTYEPDLTKCIRTSIGKGSTVIDIGANVGYYSRLCADIVKESGTVIAVEVETENYRCLCKNIAHYSCVTPVAAAISNRNAILNINKSSHSSCHSLLNMGHYQDQSSFKAISMKLDLFWNLYLDKMPVDLLKIDVEGAEILVLEGMKKMLNSNAVKMMIVEFCPQMMINSGLDPIRLYNLLVPFFRIKIIESSYADVLGDELIKDEKQFEILHNHLLELDDYVNCNLLCEAKFHV